MEKRNAERSSARILEAAERQFAQKGFFGARIDEIAAEAGINKRMIYQYHGDKERLYRKVLLTVYKRMEEAERPLMERGLSGAALIREVISIYFDFLRKNPNFVSILMWENLDGGRSLRALPAEEVERPTIRYIADEIRRGIGAGVFGKNVDPEQAAISLITVCFANFSNSHTLSVLFRQDFADPAVREKRKNHTLEIMLAYLCGAAERKE